MRKPIIVGNWKMYKNPEEAVDFIESFLPLGAESKVEIGICAPFTSLTTLVAKAEGSNIKIGAQNCHWEKEGAYTGEISAKMLKAIGCQYCIVGHSERRQYFGETDEGVNKKVKALLEEGLTPIVCVGEKLEEREEGKTLEICKKQLRKGLADLTAEEAEKIVIAYEPIWAIGTGKTATSEEAQNVIAALRQELQELFGVKASASMRIQYGGSVKPSNIKELMEQADIDGALVGGASLKPADFAALVNYR